MDSPSKTRVSFYLEKDLVTTADGYLKTDGFRSRNELINYLLRQYIAERIFAGCSDVINEKLSKTILRLSEDNTSAIAKGLFRYAVELETIIRMLAQVENFSEEEIKDMHRQAVYSVRSTKGKIRLKDIVTGNEAVLYSPESVADP